MVMSSYNLLNGVRASENEWLLKQVLRDEWGYQGVVVSDWDGTKDRPKSFLAGNDMAMPEYAVDRRELLHAVEAGAVPVEALDRSTARLLALVQKATASPIPGFKADYAAHHELAQQIARESIVLLKNEDAILPIPPDRPQKLLVVGPMAVAPVIQGSGCAPTTPSILDKPLDEMVEIAGNLLSITYSAGTATDGTRDGRALEEAVTEAAGSNTVVLFLN